MFAFFSGFVVACCGFLKFLAQLRKLACLGVDLISLGFKLGEFRFQFRQNAFLGSGLVELFSLGAQLYQLLGEVAKA